MGWGSFVDMELSDEEKLDTCMPMPCERPNYPWGLKICLTHNELDKLGLDADCSIGDLIDMRCMAEVTSVSKSDGANGEECRVELQIKFMSCENEAEEDEGED